MMELGKPLLILCVISVVASATNTLPQLEIEALKSGKLRVFIPDVEGIQYFAFNANINREISPEEVGTISLKTISNTKGFWVLLFDYPIKRNDVIHYWIFVNMNRMGYSKTGSWQALQLLDSFRPLENHICTKSSTVINGEQAACGGTAFIEDEFERSSVDTTKWIVEHRIPTYTGPNFEFNSYEDIEDVRFIKHGILHLKPKAMQHEEEVRGALDLTQGCTSDNPNECYYQQTSTVPLPPVISAKIKSKISFKYGKVEIKAKLPQGDWIYPILELEPKNKTDGLNSAKIWIAYSRGNLELKGNIPEDYGSKLLFGGPVLHPAEPGRSKVLATKLSETPYNNDFHVYTLDWRPGRMTLYVDSEQYGYIPTNRGFADPSLGLGSKWTDPEAPFDSEYVLALGVGVGGIVDFPDGFSSPNDPKPWLNNERNYLGKFFDARNVWLKTWKGNRPALQIDYVKVTAI